jgi:hypothetical protein
VSGVQQWEISLPGAQQKCIPALVFRKSSEYGWCSAIADPGVWY